MKFKKIIALLLICVFCTVPARASYDEQTDYMAIMIQAVTTNDRATGVDAEQARNNKITDLELPVTMIAWDDLHLLSKIIYAEAGSNWLSDEWKMSVGEVALNRVASSEFPNTLSEVIYQPGQYYGSGSSYFANLQASERCTILAKRLLEGERILNNKSVIFQANFRQGSGVHTSYYDKHLGWTYFCYSSRPGLYEEG